MPIKLKKLDETFTPENSENIKFKFTTDTAYKDVWEAKSKSGDTIWCKPFFITRTKTEGISAIDGYRTSSKEPTCYPPTTPHGSNGSDDAWSNFNFLEYQDAGASGPTKGRGVRMYHQDTYKLLLTLNQGYKLKGYDEYLIDGNALNYCYDIPNQKIYGADVHLQFETEKLPLALHLSTYLPEQF